MTTGNDQNTIYINGRLVGQGSYDGRLRPGEHTLRVTRSGAESHSSDFVLRSRETRTMNVTLEESGGVPTWVWIAGGAVVAGATTATILWKNRETQYEGQAPGNATASRGSRFLHVPLNRRGHHEALVQIAWVDIARRGRSLGRLHDDGRGDAGHGSDHVGDADPERAEPARGRGCGQSGIGSEPHPA